MGVVSGHTLAGYARIYELSPRVRLLVLPVVRIGSQSTFDLVLVILSGARVLFAPYFFVYGWVLVSTFHLHQAYGTRIAGFGIGKALR